MEISNLSIYLSKLVTSSTRHHGLYHGVHCHPPLLTQARTESDISGKGNGGVGGNNDGLTAGTEAAAAAAMVETVKATEAKLRCTQRKLYPTSVHLYALIVELQALDMNYGMTIHIHVIHISGRRMIAQGTDGCSQGPLLEGVMAGHDMLMFIDLSRTG